MSKKKKTNFIFGIDECKRNCFVEAFRLYFLCPTDRFPPAHTHSTCSTMVTKLPSNNKSKLMKFLFSLLSPCSKILYNRFFITFYLIFVIIVGVSFRCFLCMLLDRSTVKYTHYQQQRLGLVVMMKKRKKLSISVLRS